MLNETCDTNLTSVKFYGSYKPWQVKLFKDHGMNQTKNMNESDLAFIQGPNHKLQTMLNYKGKLQQIPGSYQLSTKEQYKLCMERSNNDEHLPKYFLLPEEMEKLEEFDKTHKSKYVIKPSAGSFGSGIIFCRNLDKVKEHYKKYVESQQKQNKNIQRMTVQEYIDTQKIDGRKVDIRILLVETSIDPLSIYVLKDGMVRFSGIKYNESMLYDDKANPEIVRRMIATNSHIQQVYQDRTQQAIWSVQQYLDYMKETKPDFSEEDFWDQVIKLTQQSFNQEFVGTQMKQAKNGQKFPSQHFRQFGLDLIPLENGTLKIIEINNNPSYFSIFESELRLYKDFFIDLINIAGVRPRGQEINQKCDQKCKQEFLDSVFDDSLTEDQKIALLQVYDERAVLGNFIPVKPSEQIRKIGKYNELLYNYWDKVDNPFYNKNSRSKVN